MHFPCLTPTAGIQIEIGKLTETQPGIGKGSPPLGLAHREIQHMGRQSRHIRGGCGSILQPLLRRRIASQGDLVSEGDPDIPRPHKDTAHKEDRGAERPQSPISRLRNREGKAQDSQSHKHQHQRLSAPIFRLR